MVMNALRDGAKKGVSKFILAGFLILATGGLVLMDVGGFFRGGVSSNDVAKIGRTELSIQSFDQTVRRNLSQLGIPPQEAFRLGYINQLLGQEIRNYLLSQAARDHGIRIADKHIAAQIQTILAPFTAQGQDPKAVLNQILRNQGLTERGFANSIARDMSNQMFGQAMQGGYKVSEAVMQALYKFQNESRDIEYIAFNYDDLRDIPAPDETKLRGLYERIADTAYAEEETRRLKIITVDLSELKSRVEVTDERVKEQYEQDIDLYTVNANRTLEQAVITDEAQAKEVADAVKGGKSLEAALKDVIGNAASYMGSRSFTDDQLIEDVKEPVMAAEKAGTVIGPLSSPLGFYVVVVKEINAKSVKPFNGVKDEIKNDILEGALIDEQYAMANTVDDMLASGMSLEEVAQEVDIDIQTLPEINQFGLSADGKNALERFGENSGEILRSGFELLEGETSPIFETRDGEMMAVNIDAVTPRRVKEFEEVESALRERWMADQKRLGTQVLVKEFLATLSSGESTLDELSKTHAKRIYVRKGIGRNDDPDGALNRASVASIFEAPAGEPVLVELDNGMAIAQVTDWRWPKIDPDNKAYQEAQDALNEGAGNEALAIYLQNLQEKKGVRVNQNLLQQVYGAEAQSY